MARAKSQFICQQCGASYPKWVGKCDNCGEWNSLVEQLPVDTGASVVAHSSGKGKALTTLRLSETAAEAKQARLATGIADLDAVLGGGVLPGGVVRVAGQPGREELPRPHRCPHRSRQPVRRAGLGKLGGGK